MSLIQGQSVTIPVTVHNTTGGNAWLYTWIDFNGDGVWENNEQVGNPVLVANGATSVNVTFTVPTGATVGQTFAQFRLTTLKPLPLPAYAGGAPDGEVEDYQVSILAPPGAIQGTVWNDLNKNGVHDSGESGLAGWTVYLDANNNGQLDLNEVSTTTAADGSYSFANVAPGTYTVREVLQSGWCRPGQPAALAPWLSTPARPPPATISSTTTSLRRWSFR